MATVYSLVCFGGLSGKTVTFTDAGDIVNLTNHGLRQGVTGIVFSTTGSLPTGIVAQTTYYPRDGADANKFTIYPTKADALAGTNQVTFSGTETGTHTVKSAYMLGLTAEQKARYGSPGSERIYAGIYPWQTAIAALLVTTPAPNDAHVCEIAEAFSELGVGGLSIYLNTGSLEITTKIDGVRTDAWHGGNITKGYIFSHAVGNTAILFNGYYQTIDGINILVTANNGTCIGSGALASFTTAKNNIYQGITDRTGQKGSTVGSPGDNYNNIIVGLGGNGIHIPSYAGLGTKYYNNIAAKCIGIGITSDASSQLLTYNNISVGNGVNWGAWPSYQPAPRHSHNFGEPTDKKAITINYATNVNNITITAHGRFAKLPILFTTSGTLPTVVATGAPLVPGKIYYVKTVVDANTLTISATSGGTVLAFSDNGSGTHYTTAVWSNDASECYLDITTNGGNDVFVDYAGNDFRPASASAGQVDTGMVVFGGVALDMLGAVKPNYEAATYPNNYWDAGPFEFDHGNGLAPLQVTLAISGMAEGSILAIYKTSDGSAIVSPTTIGATGIHSISYSYTGNTQVEVVVRKGSSGTKYLPYSAHGLITATGFSLIVNQVVDGVLNG